MKSKIFLRFLKIFLFFSLIFRFLGNAFAQTSVVDSEIPVKTQKIIWNEDNYTSKYKITVEKIEDSDILDFVHENQFNLKNSAEKSKLAEMIQSAKNTVKILSNETNENSITLELSLGIYRYQIAKFDLLGREAVKSEWFALNVSDKTEENFAVSKEELDLIRAEKDALLAEREELLRKQAQLEAEKKALEDLPPKTVEIPVPNPIESKISEEELAAFQAEKDALQSKIDALESEKQALNEEKSLLESEKSAIMEERAALEEEKNQVSSIKKEPSVKSDAFDFYVAGGAFAGFDVIQNVAFENKTDSFLLGYTGQIGFTPLKTENGYFGLNLNVDYLTFESEGEGYTMDVSCLLTNVCLTYEKPFFNGHVRVGVTVGAGLATLTYDVHYSEGIAASAIDKTNYAYLDALAGFTFSVYPVKWIFLKADLNYEHIFADDLPCGLFMPTVLLGLRL